jgi:hypothetical protein|tara:strand:- start:616 stop:795 length:180 start_codon:yes stop_codon:yes gene_type:complete
MKSKIVQFVSKVDTETYERIVSALKLYDEYLHSNNDINEAIKVRALLGELKLKRKERKL